MNLREAMVAYINAASARDYYSHRGHAQRMHVASEHLRHCGRVVDLQLAVAEAAERFAEFAATHHHTDVGEEVYEAAERLLREYMAAREAVRKLEEQDKGGKR